MELVYVVSVFLHLLAAAFWVGGMLFLAVVVVPALRGVAERVRLVERIGVIFERVGIGALVLLFLTGVFNLWWRVGSWEALWDTSLGQMGLLKVGIFLLMSGLSLWHNRGIGRRAVRLLQQMPGSREAERLRRYSSWVGRFVLLLSLVLVLLGVLLARGFSLW